MMAISRYTFWRGSSRGFPPLDFLWGMPRAEIKVRQIKNPYKKSQEHKNQQVNDFQANSRFFQLSLKHNALSFILDRNFIIYNEVRSNLELYGWKHNEATQF